jgi:hypothetical protein
LSSDTARAAVRRNELPHYERPPKGSIVDAVEPKILELVREFRRCRRR